MKHCSVTTGLACTVAVGLCAAAFSAPPHFEGFEDPAFVSGAYPAILSPNWNDYSSALTRVLSGTDGITSQSGIAHGKVDSTAPPAFTGIFSRLGGYGTSFDGGFSSSVDVYIDLSLPSVTANTYGWDLSTAVNNQLGAHRRDFVFHAAADASDAVDTVLIAASNNSNFAVRQDLDTLANHYVITTSGWYTFESNFVSVSGMLAVNMILRDSSGTQLFQEIRSDPSDLISTVVGGNRYMWFTFIESDSLHIDNTSLSAAATLSLVADDSCYSASQGTVTVSIEMTDAITNVAGGQFFLEYDDSVLQLDDVSLGGGIIFTETIYECSPDETFPPLAVCTPTAGLIDFAVGVNPFVNPLGTSDDSTMAVLTFTVLGDACSVADLVSFRTGPPPTQLSDPFGAPILPQLIDLEAITIDQTVPVITCPADVSTVADAGTCETFFDPGSEPFFTLFGDVDIINVGPPHDSVAELESVGADATFGAVSYTLPVPVTFASLTTLSADYNMTTGCFGGGAPRFSVRIDFDTDGLISAGDKNVFVYWGSLPSYTDCPSGWNTTGNLLLAGDNRFDTGQVGGTFYDSYLGAVALVGGLNVLRISAVLDGGWSQGVGNTQVMLLDNLVVDAATFTGTATASDNCDGSPDITFVRSDGKPLLTDSFEADDSPITITWTATDDCGNSSFCNQIVTVDAVNELVVDVDIPGLSFAVDRCIRFELYECPGPGSTVVDAVLSFDSSGSATATVEVPCGVYECLTARDRQHTLRRTDDTLAIVGTQYEADFTGVDALVSGNANDDLFIDILDFGVFVSQFGIVYGSADTLCVLAPPPTPTSTATARRALWTSATSA